MLLAKLLCNKDQIKDIDHPIAVGIRRGFAESVSNHHQIQNIDDTIAVDISETAGRDIDFTIEVGEQVSQGRSGAPPIGYGGRG